MSDPYPKTKQLARGERRYRRKVASPKQWAAIRAAKLDGQVCRLAFDMGTHGNGEVEPHHLVSRGAGLGDDVADNICPLCPRCHALVTRRDQAALTLLAFNLSDAEYAYCVGKLGEGAMERLFGVTNKPHERGERP